MANKIFSRDEQFYLQQETTFAQIPNSAGAATVVSSNGCAMIQFKMMRTADVIFRKDKTGSRTGLPGIAGRQIASWSANMSLVTSGVAGTAPDCTPILATLFGGPPTVRSGTATITGATNASPIVVATSAPHGLSTTEYSVVTITGTLGNTAANGVQIVMAVDSTHLTLYGTTGNGAYTSGGSINMAALTYIPVDSDPLPSFTGYSFRAPSTAAQRAIFGCVVKDGTFALSEDIATCQFSGDAYWYADSANFSNATVNQKGGLTAFPTNPGPQVTNGTGIPGFMGLAVLDGNQIVRIRSAQVKYGAGVDLPRDIFGTPNVDVPEGTERIIQTSANMYEDDSSAQYLIEQASINKTLVDFLYLIGNVPGNMYALIIRGIQLVSPDRDDGQNAFTIGYGDSRAYGSSITAFNEFRLWAI